LDTQVSFESWRGFFTSIIPIFAFVILRLFFTGT